MHRQESSSQGPTNNSIGVLGISMGNSQFSEAHIRQLFKEMRDHYAGLAVMLPDVPAQSTLKALGYPPEDAAREARLAFNGIVNKCRRAVDDLGIPDVSFVSWSDRNGHEGKGSTPVHRIHIETNPKYKESCRSLLALYGTNEHFASDIREATRKVLEGKPRKDGREILESDIEIGVNFLLQELAFIVNAANILEVSSTDYIYHELMPVLQNLYQNAYGYTPAANTGFSVYS